MKRKPLSRKASQRSFRRASGIHGINKLNPRRMRGGIRL